MSKTIWFDMDGTLAELYKVDGWLPMLRNEDPTPYVVAKPKVDMMVLVDLLNELRADGYTIGIISWLSMGSTKEYNKQVRKAKREWLKKNLSFDFDKIHLVKYGTPKHYIGDGILVDDNDDVCRRWYKAGGVVINAQSAEWINEFTKLVKKGFCC